MWMIPTGLYEYALSLETISLIRDWIYSSTVRTKISILWLEKPIKIIDNELKIVLENTEKTFREQWDQRQCL